MHLLFLDESGQLDQPGLFALGGIAVRDGDWPLLRRTWQDTLAANAWPLDKELKWHGVRTGAVPPALADAVFAALAGAPITVYTVLLDLRLGPELFPPEEHAYFRSPDDAYATALMFLAERFQRLLADRDDVGMIVVDNRWREQDERLRRFFGALQEEGTPYMKLDRIVEGLFLGPSQYSIGLQCADLVVACTAGAERGQGDARRWLRDLWPRFAVHPSSGEVEGVGLKRFPEQVPRERERHRLF